jgi:hypothetical protein
MNVSRLSFTLNNVLIEVFLQRAVCAKKLLQIFVNPYGNSIQAQHKHKCQYRQQETVVPTTQLKAVVIS